MKLKLRISSTWCRYVHIPGKPTRRPKLTNMVSHAFFFAYSPKFLSFLSIFICAFFACQRLFDIRHLTQLAILTHGFLLKPSQSPQGYFWNIIEVYVFKLSSELLNTIINSVPSFCKCIFGSFEQMSGDTFQRISTNLIFALMPQASRTNIKFVVVPDWGQRESGAWYLFENWQRSFTCSIYFCFALIFAKNTANNNIQT